MVSIQCQATNVTFLHINFQQKTHFHYIFHFYQDQSKFDAF